MEKIYFSNKSLNYSGMEKLFNEIYKIENIKAININISYSIKKDNIQKKEDNEFNNIPDFLNALRKLNKIDSIETKLHTNNSIITLEYTEYTEGWEMHYYKQNNVTKAMIYILNNHFKPNAIKNILFNYIFIIWIIFGFTNLIISNCINVIYKDTKEMPIGVQLYYFAVALTFILLILLSIYKQIKRKKPYKNSKFWEKHKFDIIINIVFYVLGILTPYFITWIF